MSQKIKTILVNNKKLLYSELSPEEKQLLDNHPKLFPILEYEELPKLLKRPDGSLISGLGEGQAILLIADLYNNKKIDEVGFEEMFLQDLKQGLIFLPEDKDLAEKKAAILTKQLEIQYEIDRLNAEEGNEYKRTYYLAYDKGADKVGWISSNTYSLYINKGQCFMSKTTVETILVKFTQDELKQYLGIIL